MIQIDNTIVSLDIIEKQFFCDISKCKGICCYEGDSGAPVTPEEVKIIQSNLDKIIPYLSFQAVKNIKENGIAYIDIDNSLVLSLMNKTEECVFALKVDGVYQCAIEKAYYDKKIDFIKPISCHLYPIRIDQYENYEAVNYHRWHICNHAGLKGKALKLSLKDFLKEPLIRKYGEKWYNTLDSIAKDYLEQKSK
ncbi:MAG: DUF3109 family protein [Bacteroidales bacterium]|nr:DUF3109 family protein [Bacteroidales bacterium]